MTPTRLTAAIVWTVLAFAVAATPAAAQIADTLGPEIVEDGDHDDAQKGRIREYAEAHARGLEAEDPMQVKRARERLLEPLMNPRATVSFRLTYSAVLAPVLSRIGAGDNEPRAIRALIVAGSLGTAQGAGVLDAFREDPRRAVRYTSTASLRRTFLAIDKGAPAMAPGDAERIVQRLAQQFAQEQDPHVFDACVRALTGAARITRTEFGPVRQRALEALARVSAERVGALPIAPQADEILPSLVRAGGALRDAAANHQIDLPQETSRLILELGADLWAHLVERLEGRQLCGGGEEAKARALAVEVVRVGQGLMFFGGSRLGNDRPFEAKEPAEWIGQGNAEGDTKFIRRARELVGAGGILTKPPFNYPANRFLAR